MSSYGSRSMASMENSLVEYVQLDGLAMLKIIKHCHEESHTTVAQGVLLGLKVKNRLEVTNCFPIPRLTEDGLDEEEYQINIMKILRKLNIDHLHVGWYQSTVLSGFLSPQLIESHFGYQTSIEESVVLIFDPVKTTRGFLSIKAYRLTPTVIQMYKDGDYSSEALRKLGMGFEKLLYEVPIVIRNSHLMNLLLLEAEEQVDEDQGNQYLDLGTTSTLEKHLRCMMECVDELCQESSKFSVYQKQVLKQNQLKCQHALKRAAENAARQAKGEPPLPEEDINKIFKPIPPPARLDAMIISGQIDNYCQQASQFSAQALGKLFVTESFHKAKCRCPW